MNTIKSEEKREGLTFFNKNNRVNFSGVKSKMKLSGVYIF